MMQLKQVLLAPGDVKAGPDDDLAEGEFIVYPSTFTRTPDSYGDIVAKGAFLEGIKARKDAGISLPGLFGHRMDDPDFYVAWATEESEDDHGWRVRGMFDLDHPKAVKTYGLVKSRRLRELSFAYDTLDEGRVELKAPGGQTETANELRKLEVYEFSFVPIGANRDTSVVAVKSAADALARTLELVDGAKAGRVLSAKNEGALRAAYDSIGAILDSLTTDDDAKADADRARQKDDELSGEKSDEVLRASASVRARLSLALASAGAE